MSEGNGKKLVPEVRPEWDQYKRLVEGEDTTGVAMPCLILAITGTRLRSEALLGHFLNPLQGGNWNPKLLAMLREGANIDEGHIQAVIRGLGYCSPNQVEAQMKTRTAVEQLLKRTLPPSARIDIQWLQEGAMAAISYNADQQRGKVLEIPSDARAALLEHFPHDRLDELLQATPQFLKQLGIQLEGF